MTTPTKNTQSDKITELLDLIPRLKPMPGEDEALMSDLRQGLLQELAPSSPYEHSLAEQIFSLEWEATRHRRMRDALILAEIRQQSMGVFFEGKVGHLGYFDRDKSAEGLGYDLVSDKPERRQKALEKLAEQEIAPDEVLAKSYAAVAKSVAPHEAHIADIEHRKRRLRNDYDALKAARAAPVEDAVVLDST